MSGFLNAIFGGQNSVLNSNIGQAGQQAGFDTGEGEGDISAGDAFLKSILSGDATKQAQALAPQISAAKTSAAQTNKTAAEMGTRGGGTGAATAATDDKTHAMITNLLGQLTGSAATALPSIGTNLTSQGTAATMDQAALSQQRMQNWLKSILGKGIGTAAGAAEGFGLAKAFPSAPNGAPGGGGTPSFTSSVNGPEMNTDPDTSLDNYQLPYQNDQQTLQM
jgi:hypothetical protein